MDVEPATRERARERDRESETERQRARARERARETETDATPPRRHVTTVLQRYLAHKKPPPPLGPS